MKFTCGLAAVLTVLGSALAAQALDVLYEQTSIAIGNPATGNIAITSTVSDDITEPRARAFDNFSLGADVSVERLTWKGAFGGPFNPNPDFRGEMDFNVEIFPNLPGDIPDLTNPVFAATLDSGTAGNDDGSHVTTMVVMNALQQDGGSVVEYGSDLSFLLSSGTYWISIVAEQTFPSAHPDAHPDDPDAFLDPVWGWVAASNGDDLLYHFDESIDASEPGFRFTADNCPLEGCDTTFALMGTVVPEPGSAVLGGLAVLGVALGQRRRRQR